MHIGVGIGGGGSQAVLSFSEEVRYVKAAESLGVHSVWAAEGWARDVITPLAYLAGVTDRIKLGTGIMQVLSRSPAMIAMTAMSMANMSNNRFCLGLGVSGPQVMEGLHGVRFSSPLKRLKECKGAKIYMSYGSANRDPEVFENPHTLDILRKNARKHLAFGTGPHVCTGARLARLQLKALLRQVVTRIPDITVKEATWLPSIWFNAIIHMPVEFTQEQN